MVYDNGSQQDLHSAASRKKRKKEILVQKLAAMLF